jgi:ferric-dicitrate binding protein FerR (iron transport regulator)
LDKAANDDLQTAPTKVIKLFNSRMIMRIAAGLLIVAAALFFIDQINNDGSYHFKADTLMAETTLPDHSEVILSDHASLRFKEDEQGNRHVELSGSGFFTVAHDSLAPFIIENEEALITVLGTSFFVDNLSDQNKTIVSVATGSVSVNYAGSTMVLKVNEAVSIDRKTGALNRTKLTDQNFRFFKTKTLSFENVDLTEVIKQINLFYGSDIKIDPALHNCKLTAVYKNQSLDALLKVLQTTFSVELSKNGSQIYLTGSC